MTDGLTLEAWLDDVRNDRADTITYSFPSADLKREYLTTLEERSDAEVIGLLRRFLIPSGSLGADELTLAWLVREIKSGNVHQLSEFQKRLLAFGMAAARGGKSRGAPPWEGITWVLDLLPRNPRAAMATLDAYFDAHCLFMPDGRMHGISDAIEMIRAKYIDRPRSVDDALRLLINESPRTLEHLVERLYSEMGYVTALTPNQKDGGYDVLASRDEAGLRAKIHIECKRWQGNVGEPVVRGLLGVVTDGKSTNGICVTTSDLTAAAKAFVSRNPQLDFISGRALVRLMNEYLGPTWFFRIERLVRDSRDALRRDLKTA